MIPKFLEKSFDLQKKKKKMIPKYSEKSFDLQKKKKKNK